MNVPGANPTHLWLEPGYPSEKVVLTNAVTPCLLQTVSISGGSVISFSYTASSGRRFLSDVQVRNASGRTVRSCSLSGTGVAGSAVRFLKSVSIPGLGTWAFDYIGEDSSAYGGADAMAWMTDWDGFYNGTSFENTVSGAGASSMPSKAATLKAARQPSLAAASLTMLSSVTWPTGGRTGFSYALNSYESSCPSPGSAPEPVPETTAPGLRLAAADSYDLDGTQLRHVSYAYDGGVLLRKPAIYFNYSIGSQNLNFDREVVNTLSNMGFGKDPGVVYSRVTERVSRSASSPAAGTATTEYEFFGPGDGESGIVLGGPCTLPWNVVDWNFGVTDRGSEWDNFRSWTSGLYSGRFKRITAYRGSGSGPVMISRRSFSCGSYVQKWVADEAAQDNREPYAEWPAVWMCSAQHCVIVNPRSAYDSDSVMESFDTSGSLLCSVPSSASVDALGRVSAGQTTDSGGLALRTEYQYVGQTPFLQSVTVRRGGTLVSRRGYTYTQRSGAAGYTYCRPASVTRTPVSSSGGAGTDQTVVAFTRFDAFDNVTRSVDAMGNRTDWGWDSSGQYLVSQSRYPAGSSGASLTTSWSWMPLVGVTSVSSPSRKTVRYSYDSCGRLEDVSDTAGDTLMQYAYHLSDAGGAFSWMRARTFRTAAQAADDLTYYNGLGYPVMERNVLFSPGYDLGKPLTYDALGREDRDWLPAPFEDVGYSENEWADFFLPAQADVLTYYQDLYGSEPEADEDPVPVRPFTEKTMEFTPEGRLLSSAIPGERYHMHPTAYEYLAGTIDGRSVTGISSTDGDGRETVEWKDYEDRTVARDRVAGGVTARTLFRYDRRGNLTEVVTPEGSSYTYTYDALSRVISKTIPGKEAETFTYDALDRIVTSQDGNQRAAGVTIRYYYDALGNLTLKTAVRGGVTRTLEEHSYSTSSGLLTGEKFYKLTADGWISSSDYLGRTYTYDSEERVTSVVETDYPLSYSLTTDYSYDLQGNVTQRTETLAKGGTTLSVTTERGYDARSRPISETVRLGNTTVSTVARSYDELGRPAQTFYGTGAGRISEGFAYTIQGWPSYRGGSLMTEGYGYEGTSAPSWTGKITRWDWRHLAGAGEAAASYPARSEALAYDGFGRLAGSAMAPGNSWSERSISYDLDGNLLHLDRYQADASAPDAALSFTYNGNHRPGYTYDANGNVTFDPLRGFEISHNLLNLPSEVRIPAGAGGLTEDVELAGTVFYADGTRAGVIDPGTGEWTSRYIGSLIYSGTDGGETLDGVVTADGFIDCGNGVGNAQMQYFLRDHLGSVRVVATDRDNVLSRTDYLPFGARMTGNGLPEDSSSRSAWFGFAGKENEMWDAESSTPHWLRGERYQHFGARNYDPASCIFLQPDPLAEKYYGISPFAYCAGDPVNRIDADGSDIWTINADGYVEWKESADRHYLYYINSNGQLSDDFVEVSSEDVLNNLEVPGSPFYSRASGRDTFLNSTSSTSADDIFKLFKFAADHTNVEWVVHRNGNVYTLGTAHLSSSSANYEEYRLLFPDASIHSHPHVEDNFNSEKESLGYPMKRYDFPMGDYLKVKRKESPRFNYVYFPVSKRLYNVEIKGPIFIRNISSYKDFYFGTLNIK